MRVPQAAGGSLASRMQDMQLQDKAPQRAVPRRPLTAMELTEHYLSQALAHLDHGIIEPMVPVDPNGDVVTVPLPNVIDGEHGQLRLKPDAPRLFIISWLDHSEKYGLGYALCNGTVGVHFRD